jgi:hypothetical protein
MDIDDLDTDADIDDIETSGDFVCALWNDDVCYFPLSIILS